MKVQRLFKLRPTLSRDLDRRSREEERTKTWVVEEALTAFLYSDKKEEVNDVAPAKELKIKKAPKKEVAAFEPEEHGFEVSVILYLNAVSGRGFKVTKTSLTPIMARRNEGYTLDQFKTVIDKKYEDWKGGEYEKYLQPSTLFGNKFDQYLNQVINKPASTKATGFKPVHDHQRGFLDDDDDFIEGELDE